MNVKFLSETSLKGKLRAAVLAFCCLPLLSGCQKAEEPDEETACPAEETGSDSGPDVPKGPKIENWCFDTELTGWGSAVFSAYAPDTELQEESDAVFELETDGGVRYIFPYVMEGNRRPRQRFSEILDICIQDYDGDGYEDVIILAEYRPFSESPDEEGIPEVRLYRNQPDQQCFLLDTERMDALNRNQWNHSVREVLDHMGDAGQRMMLDFLTELMEDGA